MQTLNQAPSSEYKSHAQPLSAEIVGSIPTARALSSDEAHAFECEHHLVNRGWA
jgi:hypothetical protein